MAWVLQGVTPGRYDQRACQPRILPPETGPGSASSCKRMSELAPTYLAPEHEGLHLLWMCAAMPTLLFTKNPVRKLDDLKGMKIRYTGV